MTEPMDNPTPRVTGRGWFVLGTLTGLALLAGWAALSACRPASAQPGAPEAGATILAVPGPVTDRSVGVRIIDTRRRAVAVYEYDRPMIRLQAVRHYRGDVPTPESMP